MQTRRAHSHKHAQLQVTRVNGKLKAWECVDDLGVNFAVWMSWTLAKLILPTIFKS